MTTLSNFTADTFPRVDIGVLPNDGTGDNIRDAFNTMNQDFFLVVDFLMNPSGPTLSNANISGTLTSDMITANSAVFNDSILILSNTESFSTNTGSLVTAGGIGVGGNVNIANELIVDGNSQIHGDLFVDGTIFGDIEATTLTANTLGVIGDSICGGNVVINGTLTVFGNVSTVTTSEYLIQHPTIELGHASTPDGSEAALTSNDGKDRGIAAFWYDESTNAQQIGFFGINNATTEFTYIPRSVYSSGASIDNDIYLGEFGNARFTNVTANITSTGESTFNVINADSIITTGSSGITGVLSTPDQPNITSLGALTNLTVDGNTTLNGDLSIIPVVGSTTSITVTAGNIAITGPMTLNGSPIATAAQAFHGGSVSLDTVFTSTTPSLDSTTGAIVVMGGTGIMGDLNVGGATNVTTLHAIDITSDNIAGTIVTPSQPNITSVGALDSLNVVGTTTTNNLIANNSISASTINASLGIYGPITYPAQPNITSVGTLTDLTVTGNITTLAGKLNGDLVGNVAGDLTGQVLTAIQPSITQVGTLSSLSVSGIINAGSITTASGNISSSSGNITTLTGNIETGSSVIGAYLYGQIKTAAQPNITQVGQLASLDVLGTSVLRNDVTLHQDLLATGAGTQDIGTSTNRFGTVYSTNINSSGNITTGGSFIINAGSTGGVVFPDGTTQTTAGAANGTGSVAYADIAGSITNQQNSATIVAGWGNVAFQIVQRDGSGSFSAGTINATTFVGPASGNVFFGNVSGNVSGSASTVRDAAQPAITSIGSLTGLIVTGNTSLRDTTITGNVTINGTGTIINASTVTITDTNITLAKGVITAAAANGAGLTIDGPANATLLYASADDSWNFNKKLSATSFYGSGEGLTFASIPNSALQNTGALNVTAGTGLSGGGGVALGGSITLSMPSVGTPVANKFVKLTTDLQGRVSATSAVIASDIATILGSTSVTNTTNTNITNNNTTPTTVFPTWVAGSSGYNAQQVSNSKLTFVPSTGTLSASYFSGDGSLLTNVPYSALSGSPSGSITIGSTTLALGSSYPSLTGMTSITAGNISVTGDAISSVGTTITIDPSSAGPGGTVIIAGNLQVTGTTTTVDSTTLTVSDSNITVAKNAITAGAANGAGLTIGNYASNPTMLYGNANNNFTFNRRVDATSFYGAGTGLTGSAPSLSVGLANTVTTSNSTSNVNYPLALANNTSILYGSALFNPFTGTLSAATFSGSFVGPHNGDGSGIYNIQNSALPNSGILSVNPGIGMSGGGGVSPGGTITLNNAGVISVTNGGHITVSAASGNIVLGSDATPNNVNSTIVARDAGGNFSAGIITGTATNARYADLAEKYQSDGQYEPGTVVVFGGNREVTVTGYRADVSVAGVVSTAPAYLMNIDAPNSVAVALRGKVPVKLMGPVRKGDLLITSYLQGYAESVGKDKNYGVSIFAKSLTEDLSIGPKIINAVIM